MSAIEAGVKAALRCRGKPASSVNPCGGDPSVRFENCTQGQGDQLPGGRDNPRVTWDHCTIVSRAQRAYGTRDKVLGASAPELQVSRAPERDENRP